MSTYGVEPITRVSVVGFEFTDKDNLATVSGLDNVVKVSGSGNSASVSVEINDTDRQLFTYIQTNDLHFKPVLIEQSLNGGASYTPVFSGLVNSPVSWSSDNLQLRFEVLNRIEAGPIGCIVEDNDPAADTTVDDSLIGKPWPMAFGSVIQQPTVGFISGEDLDIISSEGDAKDRGNATVSSPFFAQLTEADIRNYVAAVKNTYLAGLTEGKVAPANDRILYEILKDKDRYSSDDFKVYFFEHTDLATITEDSEKLSDTEADIYRRSGSEAKKLALKAAVEQWCKKYLEGLGKTSQAKLDQKISNPTSYENDWAEEFAHQNASYSTAYNSLKGDVGKPKNFLDKIFITNSTLVTTNTDGMVVNINGAKLRTNRFDDFLQFQEFLPACQNIKIQQGEADRPNTFKSTEAHNITNMYCRINDYILYVTGSEIEYSTVTGDFESVTYTYVPVRYEVKSDKIDAGLDPKEQYIFQVLNDVIKAGTINEASVTWLETWGGTENIFAPTPDKDDNDGFEFFDNELRTLPGRVVGVNDQGQQSFDQFAAGETIINYAALPPESWTLSPGSSITPWTGCPSFEKQEETPDGDTTSYAPRVYITNCIPNTVVHAVYVKEDGKRLVQVASTHYNVIANHTIAGMQATVVWFSSPPSTLGEDWGDEIFVTQTSPVGPNTIDEMVFLINTYSSLAIDSSLTDIAPLIANYPSNFTYFDNRNLLTALQEMGFQSRVAVWIEGDTVFGRYLAKEEAGVPISNDAIEEGGVVLTYTPSTDQLVTAMKGKYRERYTDLDEDGNEKIRKVVVQNNEDKYGTFEEEVDYYIYNSRELVQKSVNFWMQRKSIIYKQLTLTLFLDELAMEPFEVRTFAIPGLLTGKGEVQKVTFDSSSETVTALLNTNVTAEGDINTGYWTA